MTAAPLLPYGRQSIDEDDIKAVADALRADFLTTGPKVAEFEKALCEATGAKEAVACSNGTTALHLAALASGIGKGDSVIVPSLTFLATANAIRYTGAEVIFADVNPDTGVMGVKEAEDALKSTAAGKAKALMAVHMGGHVADLFEIVSFARHKNLKLLADACHALGGKYKGKPVGNCEYESMSTFSFHPVKSITTGEGGAVTTNDAAAAQKMRTIRCHNMEKKESEGPWYYEMAELGFNYRLTDIQCALGLSQLKKLPAFVAQRKKLAGRYDELLKPLAPVVQPPVRQKNSDSAWHLYSVRIDFRAARTTRTDVMNALKEKGIGTQVHYIPVHMQPYYKKRYGDIKLPGAERYYAQTLSLPLFPAMNEDDVARVVTALREVLNYECDCHYSGARRVQALAA